MSKSVVEVTRPTMGDVEYVIKNLRGDDLREILASHGPAAFTSIRNTVLDDDTLVGKVDGRPVCLFGVTPRTLIGNGGVIWLVGTDDLVFHKIAFLKRNKPWVELMLRKYGTLENYVDVRNRVAIRWLGWLGFEFDEPEPYGVMRKPFMRFHRGEF